MNTKTIYWIVTGLFCAMMTVSGLAQLSQAPEMLAGMAKIGMPPHILFLVGGLKIFGVLALLLPQVKGDLKIGAYAGFVFLLVGAFYSHVASDDMQSAFGQPILLVVLLTSYFLYKKMTLTKTA
jgi:hypothetical protein